MRTWRGGKTGTGFPGAEGAEGRSPGAAIARVSRLGVRGFSPDSGSEGHLPLQCQGKRLTHHLDKLFRIQERRRTVAKRGWPAPRHHEMVEQTSHLFGSRCHGEMRSRRLNQNLGRLLGEAMTSGERASTDGLICS